MHKFPITKYRRYIELPFGKFDELKFSIYIIDFNWCYLFINQFALHNLKERGANLIGKNMWDEFPELQVDAVFKSLREKMDRRVACTIETTSPLDSKRLYITGYPLEDCFYFSASILPDRQELITDLRNQMKRKPPQ